MRRATVLLAMLMGLSLPAFAQPLQQDARGCQDHPAFTRMPTYWIHNCDEKNFDSHTFVLGKGKTEQVEGRKWRIHYYPQASAKSKPSELEIRRNFENAVRSLGGTVSLVEQGHETLRLMKDGKELWVDLTAEFTGKYSLTIVERSGMAQQIVANAEAFSNDLAATGHAAVYGILFDTNKTTLKPESNQAIGEIAKLLQANPRLKLHVVGHTDTVGNVDANLKLSQGRAAAVLQALVRSHGIATARLRAFGAGPFAPVATNDREEGRAKNRRVELVKQ